MGDSGRFESRQWSPIRFPDKLDLSTQNQLLLISKLCLRALTHRFNVKCAYRGMHRSNHTTLCTRYGHWTLKRVEVRALEESHILTSEEVDFGSAKIEFDMEFLIL